MTEFSIPRNEIRAVLFERISKSALDVFENAGIENVEALDFTPKDEELRKLVADAHIIGIRSRTKLTPDVIASAKKLLTIGCFCIGTNQVDLTAAKQRGIPVFNAPYSNTRSVAELVIGEAIMLLRQIPSKNYATHHGKWQKSVGNAQEIRNKIIGIVGYGHIGSQVSVLAESLGFKVRFYDIAKKLALGNAQPCATLSLLLAVSDVVSLHVPSTPETRNMIGAHELSLMKPGAILINAARGEVIDTDALAAALSQGHISGAGVDVFPVEPASADEELESPLRGMPNVLLTPHIGGSTLEAQENIGEEVAEKLVKYVIDGSTLGAVNFVEICLPTNGSSQRVVHIHKNVPGIVSSINNILSQEALNISGQYLRTDSEIGYVVTDTIGERSISAKIAAALQQIPSTIQTRLLA